MRTASIFLLICLFAAPVFSAEAVATPKVAQAASAAGGFSIDDDDCDAESSNFAQTQCLGKYLEWLDGELNRVYTGALARMPESDPTDDRKSREQLSKSQRAWLEYKTENCTLEGALEGGSNLWVTHFDAECEVREMRQRIRFLRLIEEQGASSRARLD